MFINGKKWLYEIVELGILVCRLWGRTSLSLPPEVDNLSLSFPVMSLSPGIPLLQLAHVLSYSSHPAPQLIILTAQLVHPLKSLPQVGLGGVMVSTRLSVSLLEGLKLSLCTLMGCLGLISLAFALDTITVPRLTLLSSIIQFCLKPLDLVPSLVDLMPCLCSRGSQLFGRVSFHLQPLPKGKVLIIKGSQIPPQQVALILLALMGGGWWGLGGPFHLAFN